MELLDETVSFIPTLEQRLAAESLIVVRKAHGGQGIHRWHKQYRRGDELASNIGDLYDVLIQEVQAAVAGKVIATINFVWMQGEREARLGRADTYEESFLAIIDQLKSDLGQEEINVVYGRLTEHGINNSDFKQWAEMREIQVAMAEERDNFEWVDTDGLNYGLNHEGNDVENDLHLSLEGYKVFGERLTLACLKLIER